MRLGIQATKATVLQFPPDTIHTKEVRQRCVYVDGFLRYAMASVLITYAFDASHIVHPVSQLQDEHPRVVMCGGEESL